MGELLASLKVLSWTDAQPVGGLLEVRKRLHLHASIDGTRFVKPSQVKIVFANDDGGFVPWGVGMRGREDRQVIHIKDRQFAAHIAQVEQDLVGAVKIRVVQNVS